MISEIKKLEMPEWLERKEFNFNLKEILTDSLYYPCCHFDGDPVKYFMGNVYSFVYVDYGVTKEELLKAIKENEFRGYHLLHQEKITEEQLAPKGWKIIVEPNEEEKEKLDKINHKEPFCEWLIFERDEKFNEAYNPKRFSLLFLYADGTATYQALYLANKIAPRIVAVIQPGNDLGINWTRFKDEKAIFARSVLYDKTILPEYLINGGFNEGTKNPIWSEYNQDICLLPKAGDGYLRIWKKMT